MKLNLSLMAALRAVALATLLVGPVAQASFKKGGKKKVPKMDPLVCVLENISIGLALDTSGSIDGNRNTGEFQTLTDAAAMFIRDVSTPDPIDNNIRWYINFFNGGIDRSSDVALNTGDQQALFVEAMRTATGGTNIAGAIDDQTVTLQADPETTAAAVILITDGGSAMAPAVAAAGRLEDAGFSLITVGVGNFVNMALLDAIASEGADGSPLSFQISDFDEIGDLLIDVVVRSIDSDGDGTPDCEDGCPADPNKTDPGFCGCGVKDTFPCPGDLHGKKKGFFKKPSFKKRPSVKSFKKRFFKQRGGKKKGGKKGGKKL